MKLSWIDADTPSPIIDSKNSANEIQNMYKENADKYLDRANDVLNEYNQYSKNYNSNLLKSAINSLGNYSRVAKSWYTPQGEQNVYF